MTGRKPALTPMQVKEIWQCWRLRRTLTNPALAARYGVPVGVISRAISRQYSKRDEYR